MTKEHIFESLNKLKKPVITQMYKNLYEDREELLEKHQKVLKNWGSKIAELEEENAELKQEHEFVSDLYNDFEALTLDELKADIKGMFDDEGELLNLINSLRIKNSELQEQLKNAIVPKYKIGQAVWVAKRGGIKKDIITSFTYFSSLNSTLYKMLDEIIDYAEKYVFATEAEAQKYLEEHHANN